MSAPRKQTLWRLAILHRLSGLLLVLFLPVHFLVLARAINGEDALDDFLQWSDQPLVKFAEMGLVFLLVVHLLGGLRLLALEWLGWREGQVHFALLCLGLGLLAGAAFGFRVFG